MSELTFKGKEFVYNHHLAVPHRPLVPHPKKSIGDARLDGNLIIHGDNLHALKSLLPMYAGKVDCIFIDPPYNTGNEGWCYNDNVNSPMMQEWLKSNPVGIEDGLRHDKWCAMMWPRLRLLHELLSETGSIWITLDDNEMHRAMAICDNIFGESNSIGCLIWRKKEGGGQTDNYFVTEHDYLIGYRKSSNFLWIDEDEDVDEADFKFTHVDERKCAHIRLEKWGSASHAEDRPGMVTPIKDNFGAMKSPIAPDGLPGRWRVGDKRLKYLIENNLIVWKQKSGERNIPYEVVFFDPQKRKVLKARSVLMEQGNTADASKTLTEIFGEKDIFETPKPVSLIEFLISHTTENGAIVLDSFAGSGTTAHAVLEANKKDSGDRKFILVECENYADTLTAERVRRVIMGYDYQGKQREELLKKSLTFTDLKKADKLLAQIVSIENLQGHCFDKIEKKVKDGELLVEGIKNIAERAEGLGGSFTYCTLGDAVEMDKMLTGKNLPSFEQLGALLFHMATNEAKPVAKKVKEVAGCGYLGESSLFHVWLIYRPELDFLKSREAALTLSRARLLAEAKTGKRHLVFAPAKFVSQKLLGEEKLPVEYAPLPWALYRVERG